MQIRAANPMSRETGARGDLVIHLNGFSIRTSLMLTLASV